MKDNKSKNNKSKSRIHWTKEKMLEEAKKYKNVRAFSKGSSGAYHFARRENLLDLLTWFKNPKIIHDKETCLELAKQYTTRWEFHRDYPYLYVAARRKGYLDEFTWLKQGPPPREPNIWTKEAVINRAKEYSSYRKFYVENKGAFKAAKRNGWLSELSFLEKYTNIDLSQPLWLVYVYEVDGKYAYIGLTRNSTERFRVHKKGKKDQLRNFCITNNLTVPDPIIKKDKLDAYEACSLEDKLKTEYKNSGWIILNKAKTGVNHSSLGGGVRKWTREKCLEVALLCQTKQEMRTKYASAYERAKKQGWLSDYTHFIGLQRNNNFVEVVLYDKHGNFVKCYDSIQDAVKDTGYKSVGSACTNKIKKTKTGKIWRYKKDVLDENGNILLKIDVD